MGDESFTHVEPGSALFFWHILPWAVLRFAMHPKQKVHETGDSWRLGRYSEADIRSLVQAATRDLPRKLGDPRIMIADARGTSGSTWLSFLWPGGERRKTIWITEGALHYLDADELEALVLHEIAHHLPANRYDIPGGWLLADLALFSLLAWLGTLIGLEAEDAALPFYVAKWVVLMVRKDISPGASRHIEYLWDLSAARRAGTTAMVNVLLKTGEEEEFTEAVLARAAKKLLHVPGLGPEDLLMAFESVRPHGRIFHDTLLRHAAAIIKSVTDEMKLEPKDLQRKEQLNEELSEWLQRRSERRRRRIRWRELDSGGKGRLSQEQVARLCARLRGKPGASLFLAETEQAPTTHPPSRDRILLLDSVGIVSARPA